MGKTLLLLLCIVLYFFIFLCFFSLRDDTEAAAFDCQSSSVIKLNNGTILYLREVNKFLALVCILREDNFDRQGKC
jgi:Ras-related GTP-binding protein C/D